MNAKPSTIVVPQRGWSGDVETPLTFPANWLLETCPMRGQDAPPLSPDGFRRAFASPIGTRPIRELARGKRRVVILFDDLSRPTRTGPIAEHVVEELIAGGVDEEDIQFICALGSHGALTAGDFRTKLGDRIARRFLVFNHNPFDNCTPLGTTARGTPVAVNREFVEADLKIGIGAILPHPMAGFGGGAKIILPGVSSIDTIAHNHGTVPRNAREGGAEAGWGTACTERNAMLLDIQEACRMSGLDVKVDALVNLRRETTALFVGEPIAEFQAGLELARGHYRSPRPDRPDVVVVNANGKVNEPAIALWEAARLLPDGHGTVVLTCDTPLGCIQHYIYGRFGYHIGGRLWHPRTPAPADRRFIVHMPSADKASLDALAPPERIAPAATWHEALALMHARHPDGARVAVIPDGTIQHFA